MNFTNVTVDWYINTFVLYSIIIFICYIVELAGKNIILKIGNIRIIFSLFTISILLIVTKGFSTTGRDIRNGYYYNFTTAISLKHIGDQSLEFGYKLINVAVNKLTNSYATLLFIVSLITIYPVIKLIYKYRNEIDSPLTILMYTSIFFFSGFSSMRSYMAASIALLAFDAMKEKKIWKALFWIIIASLFHTSIIVLFIPLIFYFMKMFNKKIIVITLMLSFAVIYITKDYILSLFSTSDRYYIYGESEFTGFGLEQIVYFLPLFLLIYLSKKDTNKDFMKLSVSYVGTSFIFGMLSYVITVFGRIQVVFLPVIFITGYYLRFLKNKYKTYKWLINFIAIFYCFTRFYIYISQYYNLEDIMPYTNIFGLVI